MTGIVVLFFLLAAGFVALGLTDQRPLYRRLSAWSPHASEADEPSEATDRAMRVAVFIIAGFLAFQGCAAMDFADDSSWSGDELRPVVDRAAASLAEEPHADGSGGHEELISEAIREAAEGKGPWYELEVTAGPGVGSYDIATTEGEHPFCMTVEQSESSEGGALVPDPGGGPGTVIPEYDLEASVVEGAC